MDLEELNKTQIILLTLLVSFVSAIATSIFTVKILEEAPPAITQTINRVVERTVERVVPADPVTGTIEQTVIEKETTVVVKEEDLITESIDRNKRKIVRLVTIFETEGEPIGTSTEPTIIQETAFHGIGIIVSDDGLIATAAFLGEVEGLVAIVENNKTGPYKLEKQYTTDFVTYFKLVPAEDEILKFEPATFVDISTLKLGQTVIALGGEERTSVATGIIADIGTINGDVVTHILTNISGSITGSPLVNIFGEVVGIDALDKPGVFIPSSLILDGLQKKEALDDVSIETTKVDTETTES